MSIYCALFIGCFSNYLNIPYLGRLVTSIHSNFSLSRKTVRLHYWYWETLGIPFEILLLFIRIQVIKCSQRPSPQYLARPHYWVFYSLSHHFNELHVFNLLICNIERNVKLIFSLSSGIFMSTKQVRRVIVFVFYVHSDFYAFWFSICFM